MNFLFTSSGRRVELLKLARQAVADCGGGSVIAADLTGNAPTSKFCDIFEIVPKISSLEYIPALLDICKRRKVDVLVPTIDTELLPIAASEKAFKDLGVLVNISPAETIAICRDKLETQKFFAKNGISAPASISPDSDWQSLKFPLIIKPKDGSSSINVFRVNSLEEFRFFCNYVKNPIIQEYIEGEEYTVDMFCGFDFRPVTIVPRRRLAVRAGEILKGRTERKRDIIDAVANLSTKLKFFGHVTIQCIRNERGIFFIEINPRFGGGAPMSIMAGANSLKNLIELKRGNAPAYNEQWRQNLTFSRFDDCVEI